MPEGGACLEFGISALIFGATLATVGRTRRRLRPYDADDEGGERGAGRDRQRISAVRSPHESPPSEHSLRRAVKQPRGDRVQAKHAISQPQSASSG